MLARVAPLWLAIWPAFAAQPRNLSYKLAQTIEIGGEGGWDYLTADTPTRRLFVSHTQRVEVFDIDSQRRLGAITNLDRIHGIALAHEFGTGFISDGGANEIVEFDLKTLKVGKRVPAGKNPDRIVYDGYSKQVFAFNGRSGDATVLSASDGKVTGTIQLGSKPEFPVSDDRGNVFVNMEEKNEIIKLDAKNKTVVAHWSLSSCESPSGLAIDKPRKSLFSVCDNKLMVIIDAGTGRLVAKLPIGAGPDAAAYDPETKLIFSSNGESGTLTVIREMDPDHFAVLQNIATAHGARTMAVDQRVTKPFCLPQTSAPRRRQPLVCHTHARPFYPTRSSYSW